MKVFIVSRGIPTPDNPMSGIFEWDQAKALHKAGAEVTYIVLDLRSFLHYRKYSTNFFRRNDINVVYGSMPLGNVPASIFYYLGCIKFKSLLNIAIKRYGLPDVVHAHFTAIGSIATSVCEKKNIPCVITEHSSSLNLDKLSSKTVYFAQRAYKKASKILVVSEKLKARLKQHFNIKSIVVPNVVDTEAIHFHKKKNNESKVIFVSTGNLLTLKGHDLLVSSFMNIPSQSAKLLIIGDGPERKNLESQINKAGLENRIKLLGRLTRKEISDIYSKADCFVLPSRRETFGVVYIEAMLAGLPVIATRCGGPEDFVDVSNGILVDTENIEQLTEAIEKMISNARNYDAKELHFSAYRKFSPASIASILIREYKELLELC